jgi:hypothetical protein
MGGSGRDLIEELSHIRQKELRKFMRNISQD